MSKKNHNAQQMKFSIKDFLSKCDQISKMKFSIKDFFSKCEQICKKLRFWPHLLKKSLMENFIFWAVSQRDSDTNKFLKYQWVTLFI